MIKPFGYVGRSKFKGNCDNEDCGFCGILRVYETGSGWEYLCPSCGHTMEDDWKTEHPTAKEEEDDD